MFVIFILSLLSWEFIQCYKITTMPSIVNNHILPMYWKVAKSVDITTKPQKFIFNDFPICIYRKNNGKVVAISDICIHRGASLSQGKLLANNCIQCPYHGWEYKNGLVNQIPGCPETKMGTVGTNRFSVCEINSDIYIQPFQDIHTNRGTFYNHTIYVPPEASDPAFTRVHGKRHLNRPASLVTENVLDMMHISYVHSFGNQRSPIPFQINYEDISEYSGKTIFHYTASTSSISSILGNSKFVTVENEFHLPDTTVTRVKANEQLIKTIVTHCYPIGKNESILHYDLYRNFMTNSLIDPIINHQMDLTLKEDIDILNQLHDKYNCGFMHTKFDITQLKYRSKKNKIRKQVFPPKPSLKKDNN